MLLADMGADVIRLDRVAESPLGIPVPAVDPTLRGRQTLGRRSEVRRGPRCGAALAERADALIEGFRPGVMERLGLGPDELHRRATRGSSTGG